MSSSVLLQSSLLAVRAVVTHAREHCYIPKYMEHFRAYMDCGNQGATNAG